MESFSDGKLLRLSQLHDRCVFFSYFLLLVARCCTYIYIYMILMDLSHRQKRRDDGANGTFML